MLVKIIGKVVLVNGLYTLILTINIFKLELI